MSRYIVQVHHNGTIDYRTVMASSYEEAKTIIAAQLTVGRIIAIVKSKEN